MDRRGRAHGGACVPWFGVSGRAGRGGEADGLLVGELQILPLWCFQDARGPIPVEIRLVPCLGFDAAIVELRNGFGGGIHVFRFHMGLLLKLAPGGELKVTLILEACLEVGCARDIGYGHF